MATQKRTGKRWSVSEVLSLQREFELLGWSVQKIADKHQRTVNAILFKLDAEGFAPYNSTFNKVEKSVSINKKVELLYESDSDFESDADSSSDYEVSEVDFKEDDDIVSELVSDALDYVCDSSTAVDTLSDRVWSLETSVNQIGEMVKQVFDQLAAKKTKKLAPLRKV
jgi:hypothetical protein